MKFILQTTFTQPPLGSQENANKMSKSSINARSVVTLTLFFGAVAVGILIGTPSFPPMTLIQDVLQNLPSESSFAGESKGNSLELSELNNP